MSGYADSARMGNTSVPSKRRRELRAAAIRDPAVVRRHDDILTSGVDQRVADLIGRVAALEWGGEAIKMVVDEDTERIVGVGLQRERQPTSASTLTEPRQPKPPCLIACLGAPIGVGHSRTVGSRLVRCCHPAAR